MNDEQNSAAQPPTNGSSSSSPAEAVAPAEPKKLSRQQQAVWDLCRPVSMGGQGKTREEAAQIMGISKNVVAKYMVAVYKKLGMKPGKKIGTRFQGLEHKKPEVAAAALVAATDPWLDNWKQKLDEANRLLKEAGIPDKVSEAMMKRLRVKYAGATYSVKDLRTKDILEMMGKKIDLCGFYLDDKVMAEASARDIMLGMSALIEKRNLLRGEPTAIVSDLERKKVHELMPLLIAEVRRRGLTVEGQVTEKTVESV